MNGIILIAAFLLAAGVTFAANWLSVAPWRQCKDKHWAEQARILYPVIMGARSNLLIIPGIIALAVSLGWWGSSRLWLFAGIFAMAGATAGTLFLDHEVFPRISVPDLLREAAISWLMRFLIWIIFIAAAVAMPAEFNWVALGIGIGVVLSWMVWARGGFIWLGKIIGLFEPAPERLVKIAQEMSSRMDVPYRDILLMRSSFCHAYAVPEIRVLLFTQRLLEIFRDDEIAAVCAHELAHLTESWLARYSRSVRMLTYLPWIFFTPLLHTLGIFSISGLCVLTGVAPRIYSKISRKLESRADTMAKANESDEGIYARALARVYADNFMPAVTAKVQTHPHLYDRLLAAGITPDFARPEPAKSMVWHGGFFAGLAEILLVALVVRLIGLFNGNN